MATALITAAALSFLPLLHSELNRYWAEMPHKATIAAQIEQESKWNYKATNRNSKNNGEVGIGLGQITKTNKFDNLAAIKHKYKGQFDPWSWQNPYQPQYEMRALILMNKENFALIKGSATPEDHLAFMYSAYNGGLGGVIKDRIMCSHVAGCDKSKWFGNVADHSYKSRTSGKQGYKTSFYDINREYVSNILKLRTPKYESYF